MREKIGNRDTTKIGKVFFDLGSLSPVMITGSDANDLLTVRNGVNGNNGSSFWVLSASLKDSFHGVDITGLSARTALNKSKQYCHADVIKHFPKEKYFRQCLKRALGNA